jgi:hypothetical protein
MRCEAIKACVFRNGSGMIHNAMKYPDLVNQQWCLNCDAGRARFDRIVAIVRHTLAEGKREAA